jgi:hypothetical protein
MQSKAIKRVRKQAYTLPERRALCRTSHQEGLEDAGSRDKKRASIVKRNRIKERHSRGGQIALWAGCNTKPVEGSICLCMHTAARTEQGKWGNSGDRPRGTERYREQCEGKVRGVGEISKGTELSTALLQNLLHAC